MVIFHILIITKWFKPEYEDPDVNKDGKISFAEAQTVADELLDNDNFGRMYITVYATNHLQDVWNNNASRRIGFNSNTNNNNNNDVNNDFNDENKSRKSFFIPGLLR